MTRVMVEKVKSDIACGGWYGDAWRQGAVRSQRGGNVYYVGNGAKREGDK